MAVALAAAATAVAVNATADLDGNFTDGNGSALAHDQQGSTLYKVPALLVIVLSVLYGSISVIAVAGNGLVIWAIVTSKRMRSVTNHYLANLAFADILIALFAIPFEVSDAGTSFAPSTCSLSPSLLSPVLESFTSTHCSCLSRSSSSRSL